MLTAKRDPQMPPQKKASKGGPSNGEKVWGLKHFVDAESDISDNHSDGTLDQSSILGLKDFVSEAGSDPQGDEGRDSDLSETQDDATRHPYELSDDMISYSSAADLHRSSPTTTGTFNVDFGKFCISVYP